MKVGDLVLCTWQPRASGVDVKNNCVVPMVHIIKGELGIIVNQRSQRNVVLFPKFGYEHSLANSALEVINESR